MRAICTIVLWVVAAFATAKAEEFNPPRLASLRPDWDAAKSALASETPDAKDASFELLNGALAERFPGITASPVPVLLPFDSTAYLRDRTAGQAKPAETYLGPFAPTGFFLPGPTGYDAVFSVRAGSGDLSGISFGEPILVEISAFAMTYDLPAPKGIESDTVPRDLEKDFPGIRRLILESHLRYSFERFGIRYVISIQCYDAAPRARRLACRQAEKVAVKALRSLRLVGGNSAAEIRTFEARAITRPEAQSPDFTFHGPGKLIPRTGMKGHDGVVDYTVYAAIRYPLATAPSYANSQSFMHWGDCDQTGRAPSPGGRKDAGYRCRVNSKPLTFNEGARENYDYPWRDNFCEHRFYFVGQCAAGVGHQGQDIRPALCVYRNQNADRCQPYGENVVAVHDGMILRQRKQDGIYLVANGESERIRFRYIHMNPNKLDEDGVLSGRRVRAGERLGEITNYNRKENGTTLHLHFEAMVPTGDGWVRVNPYSTLINAYERLIGGRGREVRDEIPVAEGGPTQVAAASPMPVIAVQPETKTEPASKHRRGKGAKSRKAKSEQVARHKTKRTKHARRR